MTNEKATTALDGEAARNIETYLAATGGAQSAHSMVIDGEE